MSHKAEVIADNSGKWSSNALRFATPEETHGYVLDLKRRWFAVKDTRVSDAGSDKVNAIWSDGKLGLRGALATTSNYAGDRGTIKKAKRNFEQGQKRYGRS
jgi:hypothetical protein